MIFWVHGEYTVTISEEGITNWTRLRKNDWRSRIEQSESWYYKGGYKIGLGDAGLVYYSSLSRVAWRARILGRFPFVWKKPVRSLCQKEQCDFSLNNNGTGWPCAFCTQFDFVLWEPEFFCINRTHCVLRPCRLRETLGSGDENTTSLAGRNRVFCRGAWCQSNGTVIFR